MKVRSISILLTAELFALATWFLSAAILPGMVSEIEISEFRQAALSSSVQLGFVLGALVSAVLGLADRYDPRRVFATCAVGAGIANCTLLLWDPGSTVSILARFFTGALLAGVYPVGMRIAVSWGQKDRGLLVGLVVGALTFGSALPHLLFFIGADNWRITVLTASALSVFAGLICLLVKLGPYYQKAARFDPNTISIAWTNQRTRLAFIGYLAHMWELYAMWAWISSIAFATYSITLSQSDARSFSIITAFLTISAGGVSCVLAGLTGDRFGKARTAGIILCLSGATAFLVSLSFGGPPWISFAIFIFWGLTIVPDSPLFSAMVADSVPSQHAGSLMTFQTALGFLLTFATVQLAPMIASLTNWQYVLYLLTLGPVVGMFAMAKLDKLERK